MSRQLGIKVENKFGAGFISEATALNFPPNACVATSNCIFTQKLSVTRRQGFNYESGANYIPVSLAGNVIQEYLWAGVAGLGTLNYVVVQNGSNLMFFNVGSTTALSAGYLGTPINLDSYRVPGSPTTAGTYCQFASGNGYLFVVHPYMDPMYIKWDTVNNVFIIAQATIQQRDFDGVDDGLAVNQRPPNETTNHYYNLANQGWFYPNGPVSTRIFQFQQAAGLYPSNADTWWAYKNTAGSFQPGPGSDGTFPLNNISLGNTPTARGHFILNSFNQDRSAAFYQDSFNLGHPDYASGIPVVSASFYRPSVVAFFAGRAWYAGVNFGSFTNKLYYSRIITKDAHIGQCYQDNDPTADDTQVADLLSSDGGVLVEPSIGQIYRLHPLGYSLIVFASNGIWSIAGSTGSGFSATDFSISKLSSVGMISDTSFVDIDGVPIWWNLDGIYTLQSNNTVGSVMNPGASVASLTDGTIKTFFNSIPSESKRYAKAEYNRKLYTIYWLYTSTAPADVTSRYMFDSCLCRNTVTGVYYTWTIPTTLQIAGLITIQGEGTSISNTDVTSNDGSVVLDNSSLHVQSPSLTTTEVSSATKFLTYGNGTLTFSEVYDTTYHDFITTDYTSFATSGYALDGQAIAKFQSPYLEFYINNALPSAVDVNLAWDFATDSSTGKVTAPQRLQTEGGRTDYVSMKRKFRGVGKAMQVTFTSVSGQPFEIAGWAIQVSTNTGP